jgi:hypothetical protein
MADFSSFFPTAGGGGGFTKMNKYSTNRAIGGDTVIKQGPPVPLTVQANRPGNSSFVTVKYTDSSFDADFSAANAFVGYFFYWSDPVFGGNTTNVITSSTANTGANSTFTINFSPNAVQTMTVNNTITTYAAPITVNPATDLGLSDGDSIGYFLVGGAWKRASSTYGAMGGKITQGTAIISNASTDLILTPGDGKEGGSYATSAAPGESTISGGLTITSADGHSRSGSAGRQSNFAPGYGINGYGQGTVPYNDSPNSQLVQDLPYHGFGSGVSTTASRFGSDGAILIFY